MRLLFRAAVGSTALILFLTLFPAALVRADYTATDLTPGGAAVAEALGASSSGQVGGVDVAGNVHAYLWNGAAPGTDLHPSGPGSGAPDSSLLFAMTATQAAGSTFTSGTSHAGLWTLAGSGFQLLPDSAYSDSQATAIAGSIIAGSGTTPGGIHALVWTNPSLAATDLHPGAGYSSSSVGGTDGVRVVGTAALNNATDDPHGALWNLSTSSFSDIHPATGFVNSNALSVAGGQVVGYGLQDNSVASPATHAILWTLSGLNDSSIVATDIHPAGFEQSFAAATDGSAIVGYATDSSGFDHAILWQSPTLTVDLSQFLTGDLVSSQALGIDAQGDIVGNATDSSGNQHAIQWSPTAVGVPEPASAVLLGIALGALLVRRRRGG